MLFNYQIQHYDEQVIILLQDVPKIVIIFYKLRLSIKKGL